MSQDLPMKNRGPRIRRAFTVRINEEISAQIPKWDIVMAQDISESGILFNFDHYLAPGALVRFKIKLPSGADVECDGEIVRNVMGTSLGPNTSEQPVCGVAAVFRNVVSEDIELLRELIAQCLVEEGAVQGPEDSLAYRSEKIPRGRRIDRSYFTRIRTDPNGKWEIVSVRNISESGILFNYGAELEIGHSLSLSIRLPFVPAPVMFTGAVVRIQDETRPAATIKNYAVGVGFSELDAEIFEGLREQGEQFGHD